MRYLTLDNIVKGELLNKGYPLHWYFRFLNYGANCVQELGFNTLKNINSKLVDIDQFGQGELPVDYVDWVKVGLQRGQFIKTLTQQDAYGAVPNIDSDGIQQRQATFGANGFYGYTADGIGLGWNTGYYGGYYGCINVGAASDHAYLNDGFRVLPEQGIIQLSEHKAGQKIVLEYISTTGCADMMTKINPLAKFAIQAFIEWQHKKHTRTYNGGEVEMARQEWFQKRNGLRASLNPLTCEDIMRIYRKSYSKGAKG